MKQISNQYSYLLGVDAFLCGKDLKDNPYTYNMHYSNDWGQWVQGWFDTAWYLDPQIRLITLRNYYGV
jgi:hypothetical protein